MTDADFEFGPEIQAAFEHWLTEHWPTATAAFAMLAEPANASRLEAAKSLAAIIHDLSGTAALIGHSTLGTLAHALAQEGRQTHWVIEAGTPLERLWRALATAVDSRNAVDRDRVQAALLASVVDLLD
jgi:HPt (histidine-containing phosphotransfer) domain-containing protein